MYIRSNVKNVANYFFQFKIDFLSFVKKEQRKSIDHIHLYRKKYHVFDDLFKLNYIKFTTKCSRSRHIRQQSHKKIILCF